MKVDIVVTSKEIVRPSSPTLNFHGKYQLSFLDQISPSFFIPIVYFYPLDGKISNIERSNRLKTSLSAILTRYYPLAGCVVDDLYIDCNDEGVDFYEAKANINLSEFLHHKLSAQESNKFLPYQLFGLKKFKNLCMGVQVIFFACGGMALGLTMSHRIADALSFYVFSKSWAAITRGDNETPYPKFEGAKIFPPRHVSQIKPVTEIIPSRQDDIMTKILVFPSSKIASLRERYANEDHKKYQPRPTKIEALSTFVLTRIMASTQANPDSNRTYALEQIINLRSRFDPPLSMYHFGNMVVPAVAMLSSLECKEDYYVLNKMKEALSNINGDYVAKLQKGRVDHQLDKIKGKEVVSYLFSSMYWFGSYDADFGWGRPVWVAYGRFFSSNIITFYDTRSGDGVEAWIHLNKEDMAKFDEDHELLCGSSNIKSNL